MTTPSIIAHRGYSALYRENSPAAWAGAIEANADHIEVDVRITRDGQIVCSHDNDLNRLTGRGDTVSGSTDLELAKIEVDGSPAVPSLRLLFQTVPRNQSILLDVKDEQPRSLDILLTALAQEPGRELVLALHDPATVRCARDAGWSRKILGLVTSADEEAFFNAGGDIVRIWEWDTAEGRIASHVSRGRPVWISTGDGSTGRRTGEYNSDELLRMFREGATGFSVNDPVSARQVFRDAAGE